MRRRASCTLRRALGESEECPGAACPFWDDDACALAAVERELLGSPELSRHLLGLRRTLERAQASDDIAATGALFHRLLNDEQAAEG